jgi:uncharacterized phosphatase
MISQIESVQIGAIFTPAQIMSPGVCCQFGFCEMEQRTFDYIGALWAFQSFAAGPPEDINDCRFQLVVFVMRRQYCIRSGCLPCPMQKCVAGLPGVGFTCSSSQIALVVHKRKTVLLRQLLDVQPVLSGIRAYPMVKMSDYQPPAGLGLQQVKQHHRINPAGNGGNVRAGLKIDIHLFSILITMKQLYFCRHGLSQFGLEGKWAGSSETPLAPEGRQQAKTAGSAAKLYNIEYIMSSPLSRAHETAKIIAREIDYPENKIELSHWLVERDFGELEGTPYDPVRTDFSQVRGIESLENLFERARLALKHLHTLDADTILIVSHGSFGRALRHVINPKIPFNGSRKFENAKIVRLS